MLGGCGPRQRRIGSRSTVQLTRPVFFGGGAAGRDAGGRSGTDALWGCGGYATRLCESKTRTTHQRGELTSAPAILQRRCDQNALASDRTLRDGPIDRPPPALKVSDVRYSPSG